MIYRTVPLSFPSIYCRVPFSHRTLRLCSTTCWSLAQNQPLQVVYDTRHMSKPPTFLANASLDSNTPLDVARNIHSPKFKPGTTPPFNVAGNPLVNLANSETSTVIRREGLLIIVALLSTGLPSQYFKPTHSRRFATLAVVTGSGACEIICSGVGG